jgi:hypothetical protein
MILPALEYPTRKRRCTALTEACWVDTTKLAASCKRSSSGSSGASFSLLGCWVTSSTKWGSARPAAASSAAPTTRSTSFSEIKAPCTREGLKPRPA